MDREAWRAAIHGVAKSRTRLTELNWAEPRLSHSTKSELPVSHSRFPLAIYFTHGNIYVSVLFSQFIPPSPSPIVSTSLFSMSASPLLPCKMLISTIFLDSIICIDIQYLFFFFQLASLCITDLEQGFLTGVITQRIQGVCKLELERIYIFIFINYDLAWLSECKQQAIVSIVITLTFYQYKSQILLYHTITISYITKYYQFSSHRITLLIVIGLYISLFLNVLILKYVYSVQFSSVAQLCLTLCNPMNHSMPGLPVHYQLPEFTQTHVHRVGDAI